MVGCGEAHHGTWSVSSWVDAYRYEYHRILMVRPEGSQGWRLVDTVRTCGPHELYEHRRAQMTVQMEVVVVNVLNGEVGGLLAYLDSRVGE